MKRFMTRVVLNPEYRRSENPSVRRGGVVHVGAGASRRHRAEQSHENGRRRRERSYGSRHSNIAASTDMLERAGQPLVVEYVRLNNDGTGKLT
jgi:hypothetical protein